MTENNTSLSNTPIEFNPFEGPEVADSFLTTESQLEIWLSCKLGGNDANRAFNESLSLKFEGNFNRSAFEKALNSLIVRHQSLRSAFSKDGSHMLIFKDLPFNYSFEDFSMGNLTANQKQILIKKRLTSEVLHIFDLLNGPLFRFNLLKITEREYYFTLTAHHIICDGWSIGILIQDLSKLYTAYALDITPELPEVDLFSDYAREEYEYIRSNEYVVNENFWLDQFKNNIPVLNLPTDFTRPIPRTFKSARMDFQLKEELSAEIKLIGINVGCSFVNTILAAFELYLHAITKQEDIIIGLPAAGQLVSGKFELVGHCVNLLPIRSYPNQKLTFKEYLKVRKIGILDAYEHQKLTFSSLLKKIRSPRDASRIPLVPVVFNIDMEIGNDLYFEGLEFEMISNPREFENFELFLNLWGVKSSFRMEWSYNTQLFKGETILKMINGFRSLLEAIVLNPSLTIEDVFSMDAVGEGVESADLIKDRYSALRKNAFKNLLAKQMAGEQPIFPFLADNIRPANYTYTSRSAKVVFDEGKLEDFKALLAASGYDLYVGLVALINVLAFKYSDQTDTFIGIPLKSPESILTADETYMFPLRCQFGEDHSFIDLLQKVNKLLSELEQYNDFPIRDLSEDRISNHGDASLNSTIVSFQRNNQLPCKQVDAGLSFLFNETANELVLNIEYDGVLFHERQINQLLKHCSTLMGVVTKFPRTSIADLEFLDESEKQNILYHFNQTEVPYPSDKSIVQLFEEQVSRTPVKTALVFEDKELSYQLLNEMSDRLANYMKLTHHIRPGDFIGIKLERSEWLIISILAILKNGAAYLPLDMEYPEARLDFMLKDANCRTVIDEGTLSHFKSVAGDYKTVGLSVDINSSDLAYIMYTSGSTGHPKGVMVEHKSVVRLVMSTNYVAFTGNETLLSTGAFSFDATTFEYWGMLLHGGTLIISSQRTLLDIRLLSAEMSKRQVDMMWFTSGWLNQLIDSDITIFRNLKYLLAGGDRLSTTHIYKLCQKYPDLIIINGYGPTENTTFSLTYQIAGDTDNIPVGKPISNSTAFILDKKGHPVPVGVVGEIYLGGDGVARGYLNNESLTKEKFIPNPFKQGDRLYKSGDLGRWLPDGNIEFHGRKDQQVKIRGYRIELGEIEDALQQFQGAEKCTVMVFEDAIQNKSLIAYLESKNKIQPEELRAFLMKKLPVYMVPGKFVQLKKLPLTSNGKIDRKMLLKSEEFVSEQTAFYELSDKEKIIARMWCDLLHLNTIKNTDNFFEIGGHSLIAIQFIIRLENELDIKLPMSALFEYPTIEKITKLVYSDNEVQKWKSLVPIKTAGKKVPLYLIHGGGLGVLIFNNIVIYLDSDQPVYGLQALGMDGMDEPLETIEEMASFYISEILEQNPDGPYHLAGLSAGGLIAFEMAQQLKTMGKELKSVSVFDFNLIEIEEAKTMVQKLDNYVRTFVPSVLFNVKSIFIYPKKTIWYYALCLKYRYLTMSKRLGFEKKEELNPVLSHLHYAISKINLSIKKYKLRPYDGLIDLFISKEKVYYQKDPVYMGWKPYALKGINIHEVNGDHDDMILQPNNKYFAEVLQKLLNSKN